MKKIRILFLAGLLTFSLAACGNTAESGEPQSSYSQTESAEESTAPASSRAASPAGESGASSAGSGSHILIAYFSRVGNTDFEEGVDAITSASLNLEGDTLVGNAEVLARMAQQETGGDLFRMETVEKYPSTMMKPQMWLRRSRTRMPGRNWRPMWRIWIPTIRSF